MFELVELPITSVVLVSWGLPFTTSAYDNLVLLGVDKLDESSYIIIRGGVDNTAFGVSGSKDVVILSHMPQPTHPS